MIEREGRFAGKVALITGGGSGIGLATGKALAAEGARVVLAGHIAGRNQQLIDELQARPGQVIFQEMDVRNASQVTQTFREVDRLFGGLDILFNNAGVNAVGTIDTLPEEVWDACFDTNLKGTYFASREAIPRLRTRGGGVIINNASNAGLIARSADPAYCASKAGLVMLTRAMALAHAPDRIRVNAVCPGPVTNTRIMERSLLAAIDRAADEKEIIAAAPLAAALGRMITPEEVAAAVLYLCSDDARMVTGAAIAVDGGKSAGIAR